MLGQNNEQDIITGIDVGSTAIRVAVGQVDHNSDPTGLKIIGAVEAPSEGVSKGVVNSIEDTVSSISQALEKAERLIGIPIEDAWVGFSDKDIKTKESKGVIAVAKSDGEISHDDVDRAVEAARTVAPPLNYEMLHVIPRRYTVDGQEGIKDPVGMTGVRLEVETKIIHGLTTHLNNISKAVYRTGIDINDLVLSVLAAGDVVTTEKQRDLGVATVNIGGSITSLVVYENGDIIHTATIPIGSEHITNDLAIGLRSSIDIAEKVKINYGYCVPEEVQDDEKIDLSSVGAEESETISREYIAQVIKARTEEIFEKVDEELRSVQKSGLLPAGVVFTGGGSKLGGIDTLAKDKLRLPASLGYPKGISSITEEANDLSFTTAIGLIKWGASLEQVEDSGVSFDFVSGSWGRIKDVFKSLLP
ncbi:MAG: cell division protein FtsA [Candidatus Magasanikbacteria bacterium]